MKSLYQILAVHPDGQKTNLGPQVDRDTAEDRTRQLNRVLSATGSRFDYVKIR